MTHDEILNNLSDCINQADEHGVYDIGDTLFEIIIALHQEWGMDDDDLPDRELPFRDWAYAILDRHSGTVLKSGRGFETESDAETQAQMEATADNIKNYTIRTYQH